MLNYFIKNRHGVVSVFWSIILVVTLSFSSLLLEIGKKRSVDAIFQQATENAAFSVLGYYDMDLFKRFGLLAMNPDVDEKTFEKYLLSNINQNLDSSGINTKRMEAPLAIQSVDIEKMYDLSDTDVLRNQIEEVVKYRAPLNQINETFDFEKKLKSFFSEKLKAIPMVSFLMSVADIGKALCEVTEKYDAVENASNNYLTADSNYENEIVTYNKAVEDYYTAINNLSETDPDYETKKASADSAMSSAAKSMNTCIDDLNKSVKQLKSKTLDLQKAIDNFVAKGAGAGIQAVVNSERTKVQAGAGDYQIWTKEELTKYDNYLQQISDANTATNTDNIIASMKGVCSDVLGLPFDHYCEDLNNQKTEVSSYNEISKKVFNMSLVDKIFFALTLVQAALDVIQQLKNIVDNIKQAINMVDDIFKAFDILSTISTGANLSLNDSISEVTNTLPSYQRGPGFTDVRKSYMDTVEKDRITVQKQIDDTNDIAQDLGYNLDVISPRQDYSQSDYEVASHNLAQAKEDFSQSQRMFKGTCIPVIGTFVLIVALISWVLSLVNLVKCIWEYLIAFKNGFTWEKFVSNIYSNLVVSSYAVNMFPNRTTDTLTTNDKDLLRNTYADSSAYWSSSNAIYAFDYNKDNFSTCRAEYIYGGNVEEITNQQIVYTEIEKWRTLNNIILLVTDDFFRSINESLLDIPVFGWLIALLVDIIVVSLETNLDMVLLCCANAKFNVIKTDMWLWSRDGLEELCTNLSNMVKSNAAKKSIQSYFDSVTKPTDPVIETSAATAPDDNNKDNDILKWGYKDYLQFMLTFKNNDYVVTRIADLIQLEMNARYQSAGKGNYDINESYTYIKVTATGQYQPFLPMPSIPLANRTIYVLNKNYYCGY